MRERWKDALERCWKDAWQIVGRVSSITYDDGITPPVSFIYHTDGSLKTVTDASGTQGINLSASSVLARNIVISGNGLLNGVILNRTHLDEDHPQTLQLRLAGQPILPDAGGSLSYNNPVTLFTHAYSWDMGTYPRLLGLGSTAGTGLTKQTSTSVSYDYLNGLPRHRYVQGMNYQTSYRYMPDSAVMEISTQTQSYSYGGKMVGRSGMADEWVYEFDSRGRRANMLWTDMYEPDAQARHPRRWVYDYNERGEVSLADREGRTPAASGWELAPVSHQRREYDFDLMGNRDTATQGTSTAEKAAFTQDYTPNALQQYSTVAHGRVVEITGEAAEGAVVALRIDEGTPFNVDRTLPEKQTGDYNSFRYLHTVTGPEARWVKVEFTVTLGAAVTLRRGFVYVPPANEAPQHDLDGNLTDDGRWVYTWDAENRLTSMTQKLIPVAAGVSTPPAHTRLEFAYDYKNRRIAKKVFVEESGTGLQPVSWRLTKDLRFVYDGWHMIAELDATFATGTGVAGITPTRGVVRTYLWGPDVSGTMTGAGGVGGLLAFTFQGDSYYPISDANGNITAIHAPGIDQVIRFDYDPFGNRITNTGPGVEICPIGFSTKYTDSETGLVDYGLRIYSPPLARWLSTDPIGEEGGINLYGFVDNDPVNNWDYLGLQVAEQGAWYLKASPVFDSKYEGRKVIIVIAATDGPPQGLEVSSNNVKEPSNKLDPKKNYSSITLTFIAQTTRAWRPNFGPVTNGKEPNITQTVTLSVNQTTGVITVSPVNPSGSWNINSQSNNGVTKQGSGGSVGAWLTMTPSQVAQDSHDVAFKWAGISSWSLKGSVGHTGSHNTFHGFRVNGITSPSRDVTDDGKELQLVMKLHSHCPNPKK
jgi:RHS repeat-associated protein